MLDDPLRGQQAQALAAREIAVIERATQTIAALEGSPSRNHAFIAHLLRCQRDRAVGRLIDGLSLAPGDEAGRRLRDGLVALDEAHRDTALDATRTYISPALVDRLLVVRRETAASCMALSTIAAKLSEYQESVDPFISSAVLFTQGSHAGLPSTIERMAALHSVALFTSLAPESLATLAEPATRLLTVQTSLSATRAKVEMKCSSCSRARWKCSPTES